MITTIMTVLSLLLRLLYGVLDCRVSDSIMATLYVVIDVTLGYVGWKYLIPDTFMHEHVFIWVMLFSIYLADRRYKAWKKQKNEAYRTSKKTS